MSVVFSAQDVRHDSALQQFSLSADGQTALLQYRLGLQDGRRLIDFYHTYVPAVWRGRQVAALLTDQAIQWALAEGLQLTASCSYVAARLRNQVN